MPGIRPPQPSGLIPSAGVIPNAATTQPMSIARSGGMLKTAKPPAPPTVPRSTQRLVLAGGGKTTATNPLSPSPASGSINLPAGMILRCLPPEILAGDLAEFESSGAAATEVGLPMNTILGQLPSGRVEMTVQDLVAYLPAEFLQPAETLAPYLATVVTLPLMDVVMRIPPDLLSLRPDQKDVDAAVANMADPFTEEGIREQAEEARRAETSATQSGQARIVDESQVAPAEEFVPQASTPPPMPAPTATSSSALPSGRAIVPPPRPSVQRAVASVSRMTASVPAFGATASSAPLTQPTLPLRAPAATPPAAPLSSTPPPPPVTGAGQPLPGRPPLLSASQSLASAQAVPAPKPPSFRAAGAKPPIPGFFSAKTQMTSGPLTPGQSGLILPRPPSPTTLAAQPETPVPTANPPLPPVFASAPALPINTPPPEESVATAETAEPESAAAPAESSPESSAAATPLPPDSNSDELQRLAALAMAQIGDEPAIPPADKVEELAPAASPAAEFAPTEQAPRKPDQVLASTSRLELPEFPPPELAQTVQVVPPPGESGRLPNRPELLRRSITTSVPMEESDSLLESSSPTVPLTRAPVAEPPAVPETTETPAAPDQPAEPVAAPEPVEASANPQEAAAPPDASAVAQDAASVAINLNNCSAADLLPIPGVGKELAEAIVQHRAKIGEFHKLEDLLDVPGMTGAVYSSLTGEPAPTGVHQSLNELLGFPATQNVTLKDVTDRISCWPDVTGCLLSQNSGLVLVGTVPDYLDKKAIVAFAPRMFEELNKSFNEIAGRQTDDLVIPTTGTSFHILRDKDLYLTILCRVPQMPERHLKIARYVLTALSVRPS